jgi:hypothetical protein
MEITDSVAKLMAQDFSAQHITHLQDWLQRFPDCPQILEKHLDVPILKYAMAENQWLLVAYLLRLPNVPQKALQVQTGQDNPHEICPLLLQAHMHSLPGSKKELLTYLHERISL